MLPRKTQKQKDEDRIAKPLKGGSFLSLI